MSQKMLERAVFSVVVGVAMLMGVAGCRHEETVAIAEIDPTDSAAQNESIAVDDQSAVEEIAAVPAEAAVTPVSYRQPVAAQPSVASQDPPPVPQPVQAQHPAPVAQAPPPPPRPKPVLVTVPVGTVLRVRMDDHLSSHTSSVGQQFRGTVIQDVAAEGRVAIRSGSTVIGHVTEATPAKKIGGRARLSLDFDTLDVGSGQRRPISAQFAQAGKSQTAKDAAIIGGSTIGGAIIGEAINDGEGGVIGAIAGGLGGAYAAKKTKAKPVEVPAGTIVDLELTAPITFEIYLD